MQNREAKILVVEDEQSLLQAWAKKFEKQGLNVLTAANGESALEAAFKNHPDLVVIDLVMPSTEGLMVIKKLREDKWGNRVPVMFLNSWRDPETFGEISGPVDYLANNWSFQQVIERVVQKLEIMKLSVD